VLPHVQDPRLDEFGPTYALIPELADAEPTVRITPRLPLKLTARVAKLADAADLGSEPPQSESSAIEKTRHFDDPNCPEKGGTRTDLGQSWGNPRASAVAGICHYATALADADVAGAREVHAAIGRILGDRTIAAAWIQGRRTFGVCRADELDVHTRPELSERFAHAIPEIAAATSAADAAATVEDLVPPMTATIDENTGKDSSHHASQQRNLKTGESEASRAVPQDYAALERESARDDMQSGSVLPVLARKAFATQFRGESRTAKRMRLPKVSASERAFRRPGGKRARPCRRPRPQGANDLLSRETV
jgi:hypothetical protein